MSWDPTPWVVGGGAEHSPEIARVLAYAATSSAEGTVSSDDLRVSAQPTPGDSVLVDIGAALVRNRFGGGMGQTYVVRNTDQHSVSVSPTSAGGARTDLVVARIYDPQYAGEVPEDPNAYDYVRTEVIQGVPSNTRYAWQLNLGYPAIALARISLPSSTATVTGGMITDLREVAVPRSIRMTNALQAVPDGQSLTLTSSSFTAFPNVSWDIPVPEWGATHKVRADLTNVVNQNGDIDGFLRVLISSTEQAEARFDIPWAGSTGRHNLIVAGQTPAGQQHRGSTVPVRMRARRANGSGQLYVDSMSQVIFDVEFTEIAV